MKRDAERYLRRLREEDAKRGPGHEDPDLPAEPDTDAPEPARIPEPWPPPDEADRPTPDRPPGEDERIVPRRSA